MIDSVPIHLIEWINDNSKENNELMITRWLKQTILALNIIIHFKYMIFVFLNY